MTFRIGRLAAALAAGAALLSTLSAAALEPRPGVRLRALDKITGTATDINVRAGQTVTFGKLSLTVKACYAAAPIDTPESAAFLEIRTLGGGGGVNPNAERGRERPKPDARAAAGEPPIFSGWMYASSPGLNALEHPVYDVWVISCTGAPPATVPTPAPAAPVDPAAVPAPPPAPPQ